MSDTRSRPVRRAGGKAKRQTVGGSERGSNFPVVFIGALIAVVLAVVLLLTVAADSISGDGKPAGPAGDATSTATAEATATAGGPTSTVGAQTSTKTPEPTPGADGSILVACGDILAPLDKQHRLASDCAPSDLRQVAGGAYLRAEAAVALGEMFAAGKQEKGFDFYVNSGYRSYQEQVNTYNYWVQTSGQAYADRTSARPGHSEHQLGTTADVAARGLELEAFGGTAEAAWVAANSYKFGFVVSYPDGKEAITGYASEPWHIRYVGKGVAQQVKDSGLTLHEFLLK
ncbi:MAG: M15 family metallopeptidase [Dehalococcoidia bacterium]|nr:M15 family metallopeptidase [Dehalococcoidia bacterium]